MRKTISAEQLLEDIHTLVVDAEALVAATAQTGNEHIAATRSRTAQSVNTIRTRLEAARRQAVGQISGVVKQAEQYVGENPWNTLGSAAVIGLLLGLCMRR